MITKLSTKAEFSAFLQEAGSNLVVACFYAAWAGPCRRIAPEVGELATEHTSVAFCEIDVDSNADVAESEDVAAMPTFILFKNGARVAELVGADSATLGNLIATHAG